MPKQVNKVQPQNNGIELFQIELTETQLKALSNLLPKGFSLERTVKNKKKISSNPSKKLLTNDRKEIVKPANNQPELNKETPNKRILRDASQRKLPTQIEYKIPVVEPSTTTSSKAPTIRKCYNVLQKLKKHPSAGPFLYPVDVKGLGLVDYYTVIKEPMDLSTVESKLKNGMYSSVDHFAADIRKIWNNAFLYNIEGSSIYYMTLEMHNYFEKLYKEIEGVYFGDSVRDLEKKVEMLSKQINELHQKGLVITMPETVKNNHSSSKANKNAKRMEKPLTTEEKKTMTKNLRLLPPEHLRGVWEIVSKGLHLSEKHQEELEFDIESLPANVARELERFIKNKLSLLNRGKNKAKGKGLVMPTEVQPTYLTIKQQEIDVESVAKGEDEVTTQHPSIIGSDEKVEFNGRSNNKGAASPASSESSFISDSDIDDEDDIEPSNNRKQNKSLQAQQELENFQAGSHGSMLNSFIVK